MGIVKSTGCVKKIICEVSFCAIHDRLRTNNNQSQRARFEKEEQSSEYALIFVKKSEQAIKSLLRRGANGDTAFFEKPSNINGFRAAEQQNYLYYS